MLPIAVLAVGDGSGVSGDTAMTVVLLDDSDLTITLNMYNKKDTTNEFHGDFSMAIKSKQISNQEFGWCFKKASSSSTKWDCMRVRANVDPRKSDADEEYKQAFTIVDGFTEDGPDSFDYTNFTSDPLAPTRDSETNWASSNSKSYKMCTEDENNPFPESYGAYVTCEKLNAHWFRKF